jgi:hypothetical protein
MSPPAPKGASSGGALDRPLFIPVRWSAPLLEVVRELVAAINPNPLLDGLGDQLGHVQWPVICQVADLVPATRP